MQVQHVATFVFAVDNIAERVLSQSPLDWSPALVGCLAVVTWIAVLGYCLAVGGSQRKAAQGTFGQLLRVALFLASIGALPAFILALYATWGPILADQGYVALLVLLLSLTSFARSLQPPVTLSETLEPLPPVTDEQFLRRVKMIAGKLQIATPLVRLWPSTGGQQEAMACVGMLQAPQLVVTDGIMHRLEPDECDFIMAHEMAHIANGSLFVFAAIVPIAAAATTASTLLLPLSVSLPFGIAFFVGLTRILSRLFEFDSDSRAAMVTGFQVASSALTKIHAIHPLSNSGLLSRLTYATATHPSLDARLAALYKSAPIDDRPPAIPDATVVRTHQRLAVIAAVVWLLVILGTLAISAWREAHWWLGIPLLITGMMPWALFFLSYRRQLQVTRQRLGEASVPLQYLKLIAALILGVAIFIGLVIGARLLFVGTLEGPAFDDTPERRWGGQIAAGILGLGGSVAWHLWTRKFKKLQHQVNLAIQLHDFRRVVELCAAAPELVRRDTRLRYNQALAQAVCGERQAAIELLELLWQEKPNFPLTVLLLALLLVDANLAERALEILRSAAPRLARDASVPLLESRALLLLGRVDESRQACDRAFLLEPNNGSLYAQSAAIELHRGQTGRATELIAQALDLAPGDPFTMAVRAEVALRNNSDSEAQTYIAQALQAIRSSPMTFLDQETGRLEAALKGS